MTPMWYVVSLDIIELTVPINLPTTAKVQDKYCLMTYNALVRNHICGTVLSILVGPQTTVAILRMQVFRARIKDSLHTMTLKWN